MKIWMDCDPGIDDSVAIGLALAHPEKFELIGISGVGGNALVDQVTENLVRLTSMLGRKDIPVYKGSSHPLARPLRFDAGIHGSTGIGYAVLPETDKQAEEGNAIVAMYQGIMECEEKVVLVPTGPLTNVAKLLSVFPDVRNNIEQIVLMGGAAEGGNATPYAEFNIYTDETAAKIVFDSGIPIVMCGLDVTEKSCLNKEQNDTLIESDNPIIHSFGMMMKHYIDRNLRGDHSAHVHDSNTFMYLLHPEIYKGFRATVNVPVGDVEHRGQTQCTPCAEDDPHAVYVLNDIDNELYSQYMLEAIRSY